MGLNTERLGDKRIPNGELNLITDVPGVSVGHVTLCDGSCQTGVTAILPAQDDLFRSKLPAAVHVVNGFGKSAGLVQLAELGTLETPIILTNTFAVSAGIDGILDYMLPTHPEIGDTTGTINSVVMECNDGKLNDIRARYITREMVVQALDSTGKVFDEGAVGGGRGMCCYDLKGGIGSASKLLTLDGKTYTLGALAMTNFGSLPDLTILGNKVAQGREGTPDKGSVIVIIATDIPLSTRQLGRCCRRVQNGLARTGSYTATGSGEIALMFSTANRIPHKSDDSIHTFSYLHEDVLDKVFAAVTECVEESVLSSLYHAESVTGRNGTHIPSLLESELAPWLF